MVVNGTGVDTAYLPTQRINMFMIAGLVATVGGTAAAARRLMDLFILTKSFTHPSGLGPVKTRKFVRQVLPRWQVQLTSLCIKGFGQLTCILLNTGKASGSGTRGEIRELGSADAVTCMKDNWFFSKVNGRKCVKLYELQEHTYLSYTYAM